jgi:metallo-beta-lactamase class B
MLRTVCLALLLATGLACGSANRGVPASMLGWNQPFPPFRVAGNIYYVGTNEISLFLIATPAGHILIDSGFEAKVPELRQRIESLGFHFGDIKILLASHAHIDHVQGHALVRRLTGARVLASQEDAAVIASGGRGEWAYKDAFSWAPCPVDEIVVDGARVELGGTSLIAHLTPGHTRGATTWTTVVRDGERALAVVFFPSATVPPGARLVNNPDYPGVVAAYRNSFAVWRRLPCDIFLGAHASFFGLQAKARRLSEGQRPNPFIDPVGYGEAIATFETKFNAAVESQR